MHIHGVFIFDDANVCCQNDDVCFTVAVGEYEARLVLLGQHADDVDDDDDDDDDDGGGGGGGGGDDHHHDDNDDDDDDDNNDDDGGGHTLTDGKGPQSHFSVERGCPHNNASKVALYRCGQWAYYGLYTAL